VSSIKIRDQKKIHFPQRILRLIEIIIAAEILTLET